MISPGPRKPSMSSYVQPIADELKSLYNGFKVQVGDRSYSVFVRPIMCIGDTPAVADIYHLKGTASYHACRFCVALGTQKSVYMSQNS